MRNRRENRNQHSKWGYLIIWNFLVRTGMEQRFEEAYGPKGRWVKFFKQAEGYIRTELSRDAKNPRRYLSLDYWTSPEANAVFRMEHHAEYEAIDRECREMTESESEVGCFEPLAYAECESQEGQSAAALSDARAPASKRI